ncbi:MAG: hypothetical protein Q9191_005284 [Dirinaria sp. TL-2023a]
MASNDLPFQTHIAEIDGLLQILPDLSEFEAEKLRTLIDDKVGNLPQVRVQDRSITQVKALERLVALRKTLVWRSFDDVHINSIIAQEIMGSPAQEPQKKILPPNQSESTVHFWLRYIMMPTGHCLTYDPWFQRHLALDVAHDIFNIVDRYKRYHNKWSPFTFDKPDIKCIVYSGNKLCLVPYINDVKDSLKIKPILVEMAYPKAAREFLDVMRMGECDCVPVDSATLEKMWAQARDAYDIAWEERDVAVDESSATRLRALER